MIKLSLLFFILTVFSLADAPILKTGQIESYDTDGHVVTDGSVRDDGYYQIGKSRNYSHPALGVVRDHTTGLEWQDNEAIVKRWVTVENWDAGRYNDTSGDTAMTYCSELALDGGGWRLPNIEELETIVDEGKWGYGQPPLTPNVFQYVTQSIYWSSTTFNYDEGVSAYVISFIMGSLHVNYKVEEAAVVRCVRGRQLEHSHFSRNAKTEIVTDNTTGLQWQDNEIVKNTTRTWINAIDYCENTLFLGEHDDWRLPNKKELLSIVNSLQIDPAINNTVFVNTAPKEYWSSTSLADDTGNAWYVDFYSGFSLYETKIGNTYLRCVRGGEVHTSPSLVPITLYLLD